MQTKLEDHIHLRVDKVTKSDARKKAKWQRRSLSNYVVGLIEKDLGGEKDEQREFEVRAHDNQFDA